MKTETITCDKCGKPITTNGSVTVKMTAYKSGKVISPSQVEKDICSVCLLKMGFTLEDVGTKTLPEVLEQVIIDTVEDIVPDMVLDELNDH